MSSKNRPAKSEDEVRLPRHIFVLLGLLLILVVGGGAGIIFFSSSRPAAQAQSTPTVQQTAAHTPVVHTSPTVRRTATTKNTPTPKPSPTGGTTPNPYPPHTGVLVLNDPIKDNSKGFRWDVGTFAPGSTCAFTGGSYHVLAQKGFLTCNAEAPTFANFAYEVQMTVRKGDRGGMFFRQVGTTGPYYYFSIKTNGIYELDVHTGNTTSALLRGVSSFVKVGLNQPNLIAVVAQGPNISLYINGHSIGQVSNTISSQGLIGVTADATDLAAEVAFSNARVWKM